MPAALRGPGQPRIEDETCHPGVGASMKKWTPALATALVLAASAAWAQADVGSAALAAPTANISLIGLFLQAHFVVKLVMLGLVAASIWVWAIIIDKTLLFTRTRKEMDRFEQVFWSGQSLEELYRSLAGRPNQAMAAIFVAAMREWKRTYEGGAKSLTGLNQRIEKVMDVTISREVEALESKLLVLATVGSAGPFIGLFGTVWGILQALTAIGVAGQASIDKVAGPVGEALIMTAIGLGVAVPAVLGYNWLVNRNKSVMGQVRAFAADLHGVLMGNRSVAKR